MGCCTEETRLALQQMWDPGCSPYIRINPVCTQDEYAHVGVTGPNNDDVIRERAEDLALEPASKMQKNHLEDLKAFPAESQGLNSPKNILSSVRLGYKGAHGILGSFPVEGETLAYSSSRGWENSSTLVNGPSSPFPSTTLSHRIQFKSLPKSNMQTTKS